jgi:hypothetical protein
MVFYVVRFQNILIFVSALFIIIIIIIIIII